MEYLFNYIANLEKYFNLLLETEEAAELMKQEIETETFQRDRYFLLCKECVNIYSKLYQTFDHDLIELANSVTVEIFKRDSQKQDLLYAQLFDIINQFGRKFNNTNKERGFSEESIGTKFKTILIETPEGDSEPRKIEYNFSIAMLADDLGIKFNLIQTVINERFKILIPKGKKGKNSPSKLTYLLQLYYEKGCKPLNKQQVKKLAADKGFPKADVLVNRWITLKGDNYQHNGNPNNIKEFIKSYESLMEIFKDSNGRSFDDVKNHYNQLKETYPDLAN
jgi:hypothetical protein